jgi:hypothetical protein
LRIEGANEIGSRQDRLHMLVVECTCQPSCELFKCEWLGRRHFDDGNIVPRNTVRLDQTKSSERAAPIIRRDVKAWKHLGGVVDDAPMQFLRLICDRVPVEICHVQIERHSLFILAGSAITPLAGGKFISFRPYPVVETFAIGHVVDCFRPLSAEETERMGFKEFATFRGSLSHGGRYRRRWPPSS